MSLLAKAQRERMCKTSGPFIQPSVFTAPCVDRSKVYPDDCTDITLKLLYRDRSQTFCLEKNGCLLKVESYLSPSMRIVCLVSCRPLAVP